MPITERIKSRLRQVPFLYHWARWFKNQLGRERRILRDVNQQRNTIGQPRALLVYLTRPFHMDRRSREFVTHQNRWCSVEIARLLGELGYVVDAMNWDDWHSPVVHCVYDLLIGFGRANDLAKELPPQTIKIHLATGSEVNFLNQRLRERIEEIKRRRGCSLPPVRQSSYKAENLEYYDAIACIGNTVTAATYRPYFSKNIFCWNNHGYDQWMGIPPGKDFEAARNNFLYFASGGQVLIGLDLVLEVFASRPHLKLFVCGPFEHELEFVKCFHRELYETPNIHSIGWVTVGSAEYFELVQQCSATIFPICAGGSPGSVVVCMGHGLIPIVSKEAGIDTRDFGITLPSISIEEIGKAVDSIASQSAHWHKDMADKVLTAARQDFSQAAFTQRFRAILTEVMDENKKSGLARSKNQKENIR
jgi:hypothetical protein